MLIERISMEVEILFLSYEDSVEIGEDCSIVEEAK